MTQFPFFHIRLFDMQLFSFSIESDDEGTTLMGEIYVSEEATDAVSPGTPICSILHESDPKK